MRSVVAYTLKVGEVFMLEAVGPNGRHLVHRMEPLQTVYVLEASDVV